MSATLTRLPQPPSAQRNRAREVLSALAALCGLVVLGAGVPLALVRFVGNPLPTTAPSRDWLDAQLSPQAVLSVLAVVVWLAWAHFMVCVLVEFAAARRGRIPRGVVAGGGSQLLARRLVATLLLLIGAVTLTPVVHAPQAPASVAAVQTVSPAQSATDDAGASETAAPVTDQRTVTYEVSPPRGRHHDCLWDIAERTLGDPRRYNEIFELNRDRVQADGQRLVDKDLIRPGWVLVMPQDASGPGVTVHETPAVPRPTRNVPDDGSSVTGQATDTASAVAAQPAASIDAEHVLGGGALLLAGLLLLLKSRRGPFGTPEETDRWIGLGADPARASLIDGGLRHLAAARGAQQEPMPELLLAFSAAHELVLYLAAPATAPPAPWSGDADGRSWRVATADLAAVLAEAADAGQVAAPYPALVTFAHSHGFDVLVDVESAPGLIGLGGVPGPAREVALSVCAELACAPWSDGVDLTVVGFGEELAALAPDTIRQADRLSDVLADLEAQVSHRTRLLRSLQLDDVLTGRLLHGAQAWRPHVVLMSGPPTPEESERLQALTTAAGSPLTVICVGDSPAVRWRFVVTEDGELDLGVLGVQGTAARLARGDYSALVDLLRRADESRTVTAATVTRNLPTATAEALDVPDVETTRFAGPVGVFVRLLGPVTVVGRDGRPLWDPADPRSAALTEVLVAAALHREGLHEATLRAAIWPRGVDDDVVAATVDLVREALGSDADGRPRLDLAADGRLVLSDEVRVDWEVFRAMVTRASGPQELSALRSALAIGAQPGPLMAPDAPFGAPGAAVFSGVPADRYGWLAWHRSARDARALITSTTRRAGALAVAQEGAESAIQVVRAGLLLVPDAEVLWRDLLKLSAGRNDPAPTQVAAQMYGTLVQHGVRLTEPETDALVDSLLPGFRGRSA
jgi:hypothetical protein